MDNQVTKKAFKQRVRHWAAKLDVKIQWLGVRPMSNKWASCSTHGNLNFNSELLGYDQDVWDYVIVHELLHFFVPNHGKLWKSLMRAHLGDYERLEEKLKNCKLKIAVLGWGSLCWSPGDLKTRTKWSADGPVLPIEFSRVSEGGRLTLVIDPGSELVPTFWALSSFTDINKVVENLRVREGTNLDRIGFLPRNSLQPDEISEERNIISEWLNRMELDGVVWTALGPKKPNGNNGRATDDELMSYLQGLVSREEHFKAKQYVINAPEQINTVLRRRIEKELDWKRPQGD